MHRINSFISNSSMKKFIIKLIQFTTPIILIYVIAFAFSFHEISNKFMKHKLVTEIYETNRLERLKKIDHKIIIIGGSNILFGLDPYLFQTITKKTVVNLAHYRTDGMENMLLLAKRIYHKNDIILISLEYGEKTLGNSGFMLNYYLTGSFQQIIKPRSILDTIKSVILKTDTSFFAKQDYDLYNSYDTSFYLTALNNKIVNHHMFNLNEQYDFKYDKEDIKQLLQFQDEGYRIVAFHPPLCRELIRSTKLDKANTLGINYITNQADYVFGQDSIYDYPFHLTVAARSVRTIKLADDFLKYISSSK